MNFTSLNVEQEVDVTTIYISSMQAAGSSAQSLAIIAAMLLAITFAGGKYCEQSREHIVAIKRFALEIIFLNSTACYCAFMNLFMGVLVIVRTQSSISPALALIAMHNDLPGQGNDFINNNNVQNLILGFLQPEEIVCRKWYAFVSSLLILFSIVFLLIAEVLNLVATS